MKKKFLVIGMLAVLSCKNNEEKQADTKTSTTSPKGIRKTDDHISVKDSSAKENLSFESSNLNVETSDLNTAFNLSSDYLFDFDKAILKPEADVELQKVATVIKEKGKNIVAITGYTDAIGKKNYNEQLSYKRANAVKDWFLKHSLDTYKFQIAGKGALDPVAPNTNEDGSDNPEGRAKNRRVKIIIVKDKNITNMNLIIL